MPKRASRRVNHQACVYCGGSGGSADHVPPKAFFPTPRPSNLITVPACNTCNRQAGHDQDFFVATFMLSEAGSTEVGDQLWKQGLMKLYTRPRGLGHEIRKRMSRKEFVSASGIITGQGLTIEIDYPRLERFVRHVVRGLYWHEFKEPLHPSASIMCEWMNTHAKHASLEPHVSGLAWGATQWPGVFEYRRARVEETSQHSLWVFRFFDKLVYFAYTEPPN